MGCALNSVAPGEVPERDSAHDGDDSHGDGRFAPAALDHFTRLPGPGLEFVFLQVTPFGSLHIWKDL
jgi:hypothetical protein